MEDQKLPQPRPEQAAYVLTPTYYPYEEPETVRLSTYLLLLWRRRRIVLLGTVACALVALVVSSMLPKVYESSATLIIIPPKFATELKPLPLSVETYQSILESDYVKSKVKQVLVERAVIQQQQGFGDLRVKIYTGKERDQPYRPLISLVVQADSPQKAATIANTWAEVFLAENQELTAKGQSGTLLFIEEQYPKVAASFRDVESNLKSTQDRFDEDDLRLTAAWDERILSYQNQTEKLKKDHEQESENLRLGFLARWNLSLLRQDLRIKQARLAKFLDELYDTEIAIKTHRDQLEHIKREISTQPQYLVLSKAITDEALWDRIGKEVPDGLPRQLDDLRLRSELLNPVHQQLLGELTRTQIEYDTLVPKRQHLLEESARLRAEVVDINDALAQKEVELSGLLKTREAEHTSLVQQRAAGMSLLEKTRDKELAVLLRSREFEVGRLNRERDSAKVTYELMASKFEAARLARMDDDQDVKIGALAVAPESPVKPRLLLNTAIALVLGFLFSVMLAFSVEHLKPIVSSE